MARKIRSGIEYPLHLTSEIQGLNLVFEEPEQLDAWLQAELEFWGALDLPDHILDPAIGRLEVNFRGAYTQRLSSVSANNAVEVQTYLEAGDRLELIIGQSRLGQRVVQILHDEPQVGAWFMLCLTKSLADHFSGHQLEGIIARQRAFLLLSPALIEAQGLAALEEREKRAGAHIREREASIAASSDHVLKLATQMLHRQQQSDQWIAESETQLSTFQDEQRASLTSLHDLYHKQLQTQAAAYFWKLKSEGASKASWLALGVFAIATLLPLLVVPWLLWDPIEAFITRMMMASSGTFTLTPVVILTIPVIGYAWLLRQVSRVFLQNRVIADDAGYRRVMTMTFLGLTKDKSSGVTATERAIILNALFRPTPPNSTDEGPPTGLLDILKSK